MCNYVEKFDQLIQKVFASLGKNLKKGKDYEIIDRGTPHKPEHLPDGKMAIYTFSYNNNFLKIGKAGSNSDRRFFSQHYNGCASSTLSGSLIKDEEMRQIIEENGEKKVGDWIKKYCRRIDIILMNENLEPFTLELIEARLHYRYKPKYEKRAK